MTRAPLKVLVLGDFTAAPCGIRNFADMTVGGLLAYGFDVTAWDAHYPRMYARREAGESTFLPDNWADYDVIHLNWHPIALNTYGPGHFPWPKGTGPLVSVYLNDVPPWSGCPVADRADILIAPEAYEGGPDLLLVYPIPDWVKLPVSVLDRGGVGPFSVGISGVRGDGHAIIRGLCEDKGWVVNATPEGPWRTVEQEIQRLAESTVNVCWYHQQRGIAGTPSIMLGTGRPLVLNDSNMFAPWWRRCEDYGLYYGLEREGTSLEDVLTVVHSDWEAAQLRHPKYAVLHDHSWGVAAGRLDTCWRTALEAR